MQIMYGVHGERHLPECELPWLRGYQGSAPVRIGNGASEQLQLDVYGEVADALSKMAQANLHLDARTQTLRTELTNHLASISHKPASGIWERRRRAEQLTFSKVMAWLALERGVSAARNGQIQGPYRDWKERLNQLHRQICKRGFNRKLQSFVQSFGSDKLDASTLLIPVFGFLPFEDERVHSTIVAIEKGLMKNGLVYRYRPESNHERESAFLACSFWLVQNLAGVGRKIEAENLFDRLLRLRNDLGLLPEEYDPVQGRFMGNFPQALSHISLINAGWMMSANSRIRPTQ